MDLPASRLPSHRERRWDAFTLTELLVTIAIIGVLAGIAIISISNILPTTREELAADSAELLNRGVAHYNQVNAQITIAASSDSSDEMDVMELLKTRSISAPGSPYIQDNFSAVPSSSTDTVRLYWTGKFFKVIPEGEAGTGIAVSQ